MLNKRLVYLNGAFVPWDEVKVHVMSHSLGRGSAIFEVLSLHRTRKGPAVFRLDEHIQRIFKTADYLKMKLPLSPAALEAAVLDSVRQNGIQKGAIKIIGFYPQVVFELLPPATDLDISIFAFDPEEDLQGSKPDSETGTTLGLANWRKLDPQTVPVEAKVAANYLNGMLARAEARERGFKHVVMLDTQGFIAEGGTESIFLVRDGTLLTPSLGTILQSITRKSILEAAQHIGIKTVEARLPDRMLNESDELFLSCSPFKVVPVRKFENRSLDDAPGPLTRRMADIMTRIVSGEAEDFQKWLFIAD